MTTETAGRDIPDAMDDGSTGETQSVSNSGCLIVLTVLISCFIAYWLFLMHQASPAHRGTTRPATIEEVSRVASLRFPYEAVLLDSELQLNWQANRLKARIEMPRTSVDAFVRSNALSEKRLPSGVGDGLSPDARLPWWDPLGGKKTTLVQKRRSVVDGVTMLFINTDDPSKAIVYVYWFCQ